MKTSTKLLLGLFLALVVAMFGAAVSLRKQYDSLDKSDRYAQWKKTSLPNFRALKISGPSTFNVQVMPGPSPRLLADTLSFDSQEEEPYTYRVANDTLYIDLKPMKGWLFRPENDDDEIGWSRLVVQCPALVGVTTDNANCQIIDCKGSALTLSQRGRGGRTLLDHVKFEQLTATLGGRNQLTLKEFNNKIAQANITVLDSARLHQYSDFEKSLTLTASPTASLRLTGKAMAQVKQ